MAIDIFSIGVFKFKGVAGIYNVVQVMPTQLAGRNEHFPATLPRGKATCLSREVEKLSHVTVQLPDYDLPQVSCLARPAVGEYAAYYGALNDISTVCCAASLRAAPAGNCLDPIRLKGSVHCCISC